MQILLRYTIRIFAGVIILLLIGWIVLWAYLSFNKNGIEARIKTEIQKRTNATVTIGDFGASFLHTFPFISLQLSGVTVRDSLWNTHHHDLLNAQSIYAQINPFALIFGKSPFRKITVENGTCYLFTDSSGYSNVNIFRQQETRDEKSDEGYPDIAGSNFEFIVEKRINHKRFELKIYQFSSRVSKINQVLFFHADLNLLVLDMTFNPNNGSFLQEKRVAGNCLVQYSLLSKTMWFDAITLNIDEHPFVLSGKFFTNLNPAPYELSVSTKNIGYQQALALLSGNIRRVIGRYQIDRPIGLSIALDGSNPLLHSPVIRLWFETRNAAVSTPFELFTNCSFDGMYFNRLDPAHLPEDENSILRFNHFSGMAERVPLHSDSAIFVNLIQPRLTCNLRSAFPLDSLNSILESRDIDFGKGRAKLDIIYRGPVEYGDSVGADIRGNISFDSATIRYLPKNFLLTRCSGKLVFINKDLLIEQVSARSGSTELTMNGAIKNLMSLIDRNPAKLSLEWNILSPKINLHDFRSFMVPSAKPLSSVKMKRKFFSKQVTQIDSLLNACDVHLSIRATAIEYKKFQATNLQAAVLLKNNSIALDTVRLNSSGGSMVLAGLVKNESPDNSLDIRATIQGVDVDKLMFSFGNFGQDAITQKNIRGKLKAVVNFQGSLNPVQEIVPGSMNGNIEFALKNGELLNFEPLENISRKVFRDRDFSDIRFAELKDRFDLNGSALKINRMEIESTVITLFVEGVYDPKKGTDMSIQVPLSNLKTRSNDTIPANRGVHSKNGISVQLRAKTGNDGKLKITWDPFRKGRKEMKKTEAGDASK